MNPQESNNMNPEDFDSMTCIRPRGIVNRANMCYMISVTQIFIAIPTFRIFINSQKETNTFLKILAEMMRETLSKPDRALSPDLLLDYMKRISEYSDLRQEDCHEFLLYLLNHLAESNLEIQMKEMFYSTTIRTAGTLTEELINTINIPVGPPNLSFEDRIRQTVLNDNKRYNKLPRNLIFVFLRFDSHGRKMFDLMGVPQRFTFPQDTMSSP